MICAWLDLATGLLFAVLILFYGATAGAIYWLSCHSPLRAPIHSLAGVVAPFFGVVAECANSPDIQLLSTAQ